MLDLHFFSNPQSSQILLLFVKLTVQHCSSRSRSRVYEGRIDLVLVESQHVSKWPPKYACYMLLPESNSPTTLRLSKNTMLSNFLATMPDHLRIFTSNKLVLPRVDLSLKLTAEETSGV